MAAWEPSASSAVTVTVLAPAVVGVPVMAPEAEMAVPAGRPVALKDGVWPEVVSVALTWTETAEPAMPSCGPGELTVTGWPSWAAVTASVPVSGRWASESPTEMP